MTREEAIKKLKGSINLLVEFCHFATDSILCEELEDVIKYLEIDLNNAEKLHKPTKYEPLYYAKIKVTVAGKSRSKQAELNGNRGRNNYEME